MPLTSSAPSDCLLKFCLWASSCVICVIFYPFFASGVILSEKSEDDCWLITKPQLIFLLISFLLYIKKQNKTKQVEKDLERQEAARQDGEKHMNKY